MMAALPIPSEMQPVPDIRSATYRRRVERPLISARIGAA